MHKKYIIGIDEAGRGPLAGPVAVGLVMAEAKFFSHLPLERDSKALSLKAREDWYDKIKDEANKGNIFYTCIFINNKFIDQRGIISSLTLGIKRGLIKISAKPNEVEILLDGNLEAPLQFKKQKTIIGGDTKIRAIALASVVAKVSRDQKMCRLAKKYPRYGFERHKGYATEEHYLTLLQYGLCPIHRQTFCRFLD